MKARQNAKGKGQLRAMRIEQGLLCGALLLAAPGAVAAPLAPDVCASLKTEYQGLVADGAKADMDRGPEWAKTNLTPERLGKIERLITVEEQLSFRCEELLTARPIIKEAPKIEGGGLDKEGLDKGGPDKAAAGEDTGPGESAGGGPRRGIPSNIPPPKRKDAAKAAKNQATAQ